MDTREFLLDAVRESYQRIGKPSSVMTALSGGADSVALLRLLLDLKADEGFSLTCVHINHGLRQASMKEEQFVKDLATAWRVPLVVKCVHVSRDGNLEEAARNARYRAFDEAMRDCGSNVLALAHHAGDQAETMLMHLMRGTGLDGLSGMAQFRAPYWRPLLRHPPALLLTYLECLKIPHVVDESNMDERFVRNDLRRNVLGRLEERAPGAMTRIAQAAQVLRDENALLKQLEADWFSKYAKAEPPFVFLLTAPFAKEEVALQRRLLRRLAGALGIRLDFDQTERLRLMALHGNPQSFNLPRDGKAVLSRERLHILHDDVKLTTRIWPQPSVKPAGEGWGDGLREQVVDAARVRGAVMRQARRDDVIIPFGTGGSQAIWKYLSARKVDLPFRPFWPVYAIGSRVLWVPGCGLSALAAVTGETKSRVRLVFTGALPPEIKRNGGEKHDGLLPEE